MFEAVAHVLSLRGMTPETTALVDGMKADLQQLDADRERLVAAIDILEAEQPPKPRRGRPPKG